jgi:adenosine deaminase
MKSFIAGIPKTELHIHIEGAFEPDLAIKIAKRNNMMDTLCKSGETEEACEARMRLERSSYGNINDFFRLYDEACQVLKYKQDFYDLMTSYIGKCKENNVRYSEIFFDTQSYIDRGIPSEYVIEGYYEALQAEGKVGLPAGSKYA